MFNNIIQIAFFLVEFSFQIYIYSKKLFFKSFLQVVSKLAAWSPSSEFPGCGGLSYVSSTIFVLYSNDLSS